jgi:hypothetical protein
MSRRNFGCALLLLIFALTLVNHADAWPPWRRRRSYSSGGAVSIARKIDSESAEHRRLNVAYDYDKAKQPQFAHPDRIQVFLRVFDEELLNMKGRLTAEVKLINLADSSTTHVKWYPVSLQTDPQSKEKVGAFTVRNGKNESIVQPASVYRLFVSLHRKSKTHGEETVLGRVPTPYYVATSGETILDQARQQIAMRTFREFYYTEKGWDRNAEYPMHCVSFYRWATGPCTVGATDDWTNLAALFQGDNYYRRGGAIPAYSEEGAVHGDYLATATHVFMLLEYDADTGQAWTMEGNFNHTIEVCLRPVSSSWILGHLVDEHIVAEAVRPGATTGDAGESLALTPAAENSTAIP